MKIEGVNPGDVEQASGPEPVSGWGDDGEPVTSDDAQEDGDPDTDSGEPAEEPGAGEDGEQESGETALEDEEDPQGQPKPGAGPELPAGYASWDEVARDAASARQLRQQWETAQPYLQQAVQLAYQRQHPQQQAQQPSRPSWAPPYMDDPHVRRAFEAVRVNPKVAESLPPDMKAKVQQLEGYVAAEWEKYTLDPGKLVEDHVLPKLDGSVYAKRLLELESVVHRLLGQDFFRQHSTVIRDAGDQRRLTELSAQGMPPALAVQFLAMEKKVKGTNATERKLNERVKSQQQTQQKSRAAQGTKRGQRPGKSTAGLFGTTDAREIAARLKERGEL